MHSLCIEHTHLHLAVELAFSGAEDALRLRHESSMEGYGTLRQKNPLNYFGTRGTVTVVT